MTLLDDFKTTIGVTGTDNDQYYIDYYLTPAIDRATVLATNIKKTTVQLTQDTQTYDLTDSNIASPVVDAAGVQDLLVDGSYISSLQYKRDFYFPTPTSLFVVDTSISFTGPMTFKYNEFYSKPTTTPTETNAPTVLWPAIIKYAQGLYQLDQLTDGSSAAGVERKREENLEVSYGSLDNRRQVIDDSMKLAEQMMIQNGARSRLVFNSIQVI